MASFKVFGSEGKGRGGRGGRYLVPKAGVSSSTPPGPSLHVTGFPPKSGTGLHFLPVRVYKAGGEDSRVLRVSEAGGPDPVPQLGGQRGQPPSWAGRRRDQEKPFSRGTTENLGSFLAGAPLSRS